jgi:hypothetical protein
MRLGRLSKPGAGSSASEERGTQDSNLESPTLEAGALSNLASAPGRRIVTRVALAATAWATGP